MKFPSLILAPLLVAFLPLTASAQAKGKKYALLIGINDYTHSKLSELRFPENDVNELAEILEKPAAGFASVRVLTGTIGKSNALARPTKANIEKALEDLLANKTKHDLVLIALIGHGVELSASDPDGKKPDRTFRYFCPSDAEFTNISYATGKAPKLIHLDGMFKQVGECPAGIKLTLLDACRNEIQDESGLRNFNSQAFTIPDGMAVLFSCKSGERAWESGKLGKGHGVFAHYFLEGLRGKAKDSTGQVRWSRLADYVVERVSEDVGRLLGRGGVQTPHEVKSIFGVSPVLFGKALAEADEMFIKGMDLALARGANRDLAEAARLFTAGMKEGHLLCQAALAWLHDDAEGVTHNRVEAERLSILASPGIRRAAEGGDAEAMVHLAKMYLSGRGFTKDVKQAARWFRTAADLGHPLAMNDLGELYQRGEGVEKNPKEAIKWFQKAVEKNQGHSMQALGRAYQFGIGVPRNEREAFLWFKKAAERNFASGQNYLGEAYLNGTGVKKDEQQAAQWFRKAADQGYPQAMMHLSLMYSRGQGVKQDLTEAARWARKGAERADAQCRYLLGKMYLAGEGVQQSRSEARKWLELAAKQGHADAKESLKKVDE